jgi:hypothetical protein
MKIRFIIVRELQLKTSIEFLIKKDLKRRKKFTQSAQRKSLSE